jgi:hypothetical protein
MADNQLLLEAAERAVMAGKLTPTAVADVLAIYSSKCIVDKGGVVSLNGKSLDDALDDLIAQRPHWKPAQTVDSSRADIETLKTQACAGNLTAFGRLKGRLSPEEFAEWQSKTGAQPGRVAVTPRTDEQRKAGAAINPWLDDSATANARRAEFIRQNGAKASAEMARAAGRTLGGKPLPGMAA